MKTNATNKREVEFLKFTGQWEKAEYRDVDIPDFQNNPLIEALPPIMEEKDSIRTLANSPPFRAEDRLKQTSWRLLQVQSTLLQLFTSLPIHTDLERKFSRTIRIGYLSRNPVQQHHWRDIDER